MQQRRVGSSRRGEQMGARACAFLCVLVRVGAGREGEGEACAHFACMSRFTARLGIVFCRSTRTRRH
eukprot:6206672-Pleurochrysis_carterae.AAC.1